MLMNNQVLVLNQNYEALYVTNMKRAVTLIYLGKVEIVEKDGDLILRSAGGSFSLPAPTIVRLFQYKKVPGKRASLSRRNIMIRDDHACQYCGTKKGEMTVDHIIPKSQKGKNTWENLVTACLKCNNKKNNRTPKEANMHLIAIPTAPGYVATMYIYIRKIRDEWKPYMFMN